MSKIKSDGKLLIAFGLDEKSKPRAAKFAADQKALVKKACDQLKLDLYEVDASASSNDVVTKLPAGRLYSNGSGFVPNIRRDLYAKLMVAFGIENTVLALATRAGIELKGYPTDWASIEAGHMVIAQCDSVEDGWFEVLVLKADNDMLTVQWRDYPEEGPFPRHRHAVALINPNPAAPR